MRINTNIEGFYKTPINYFIKELPSNLGSNIQSILSQARAKPNRINNKLHTQIANINTNRKVMLASLITLAGLASVAFCADKLLNDSVCCDTLQNYTGNVVSDTYDYISGTIATFFIEEKSTALEVINPVCDLNEPPIKDLDSVFSPIINKEALSNTCTYISDTITTFFIKEKSTALEIINPVCDLTEPLIDKGVLSNTCYLVLEGLTPFISETNSSIVPEAVVNSSLDIPLSDLGVPICSIQDAINMELITQPSLGEEVFSATLSPSNFQSLNSDLNVDNWEVFSTLEDNSIDLTDVYNTGTNLVLNNPLIAVIGVGLSGILTIAGIYLGRKKPKPELAISEPENTISEPEKKLNIKSERLFNLGKEFTSKQKDNTQTCECKYIYGDKNVEHLLNIACFPRDLNKIINTYSYSHLNKTQCTNLTLPHIHTLKTETMEKVAANYKKKYHANITICNFNKLTDTIDGLHSSKDPRAQGIIVWHSDTKHVVPLIFNKHDNNAEIINLDVLGGLANHNLTKDVNFCLGPNLNIINAIRIYAPKNRQADTLSCRTGALILLRNALNDLKSHNYPSLEDYLEPHIKNDQLPDTWVYGEQIFKADKSTNSPIKNKKITVSTFRNAYRKEVEKRVTLTLKINKLKAKPNPEKIAEWNKTEDLSVKITDDELIISGIIRVQHNIYLALKGLKYGKFIT